MSGQTSIDKIALDFITVYKRFKDRSHRARGTRKGEQGKILLAGNPRRRERLDKRPC